MPQFPLFIRNALISVFNKCNITEFAKLLIQKKITLLASEGTAKQLSDTGITTIKISDYTKFPEIMNGRLKTLHHKIYAGILRRKNIDDSLMHTHNIHPIDMLIVNFYPFHEIINNQKYSEEEILNNIDVGGPNIVRAAIKNYKNVVIITDHNDYTKITHEINTYNGYISLKTRLNLAIKALKYIIEYDNAIYNYFNQKFNTKNKLVTQNNHNNQQFYNNFPEKISFMNFKFTKKQNIIYGENPHQKSALYIQNNLQNNGSVATAQQLQGKQLSYNNIVDMNTALECVKMFSDPTCVIVKHDNPCGVASSHNIYNAYNQAYNADPISAFGGIIAFNRPLDKNTAQNIIDKKLTTAIIAPSVHQNCLNILSLKKNIKVLVSGNWTSQKILKIDFKNINDGLLIQEHDQMENFNHHLNIVTIRKPTEEEIKDALFCWKIVKFVKSNAIVCGKNYQTTGIGSGQMNRAHAVKIATIPFNTQQITKVQGSAMASDAFFTFSDGIQTASKMGIRCIIQPGGSIKDKEIINTANQHGISMIFTYIRHFRH